MVYFRYYCTLMINSNSKENQTSLVTKPWFPWLLLFVLLISNLVSFQITNDFFIKNSITSEEVIVEQDVINSGSRIINWARDILRFFRNPQ